MRKSVADIIDDYLVLFTFNNNFEANLIDNFIKNNNEQLLRDKSAFDFQDKSKINNCKNDNEGFFYDQLNINKSNLNSQKGFDFWEKYKK